LHWKVLNNPKTIMQTTAPQTENLEKCIETCNKMLRGERSAVEAYDLAIDKFSSDPNVATLKSIRSEHADSVDLLEKNVIEMGGKPDTDSGAWGEFATLIQGAANLFGDSSAIASLKQGEEKGKSDYESALADNDVMASCLDLYANTLLPRTRRHIASLDAVGEAVD